MLTFTGFIISHLLVFVGLYGSLTRRDNLVITMICLEIALLGVAVLFALSGLFFDDMVGPLIFFMLLTLAAVESALGLALVISYYRLRTTVRWVSLPALRG